MKFEDIVALAKAGYSPKQVKEFLEFVEASPKVQETPAVQEVPQQIEVPQPQPEETKNEEKTETAEDILNRLLEE